MFSKSMLPADFNLFSPACRPSAQEIETYARLIAEADGEFGPDDERRRQAELQLWLWRSENRRPARRRAPPAPTLVFPTSAR